MSRSFWALNLKGIDGLFSGVSRCYTAVRASSMAKLVSRETYDIETVAPRDRGGGKGPTLATCWST